ncbi:hypothetical protein QE152_g17125 [Popillia japonica]|uniref:Uncharacterized protein n=1 Tax=Popillia japonica TaxID=7064 RepID=A0AAW1L4B6_POPJA
MLQKKYFVLWISLLITCCWCYYITAYPTEGIRRIPARRHHVIDVPCLYGYKKFMGECRKIVKFGDLTFNGTESSKNG